MQFSPSPFSVPPGADYDGWVTNLFTREGRAENKQIRSARKRERAQEKAKAGKTKAASRIRRRADKLGVRSADLKEKAGVTKPIQQLKSEKNFEALWKADFPWNRRPLRKGTKWTGGAKRMNFMAEGYRPDEKYINAEYRAVIAGGLAMLAGAWNPETDAVGYAPFNTKVDVDSLPSLLRAKGQKHDEKLIKMVKACWNEDPVRQRATRNKDKPPRTLRTAAEYIQKAVIDRYIAKPAWAMRAMYMVGISLERSRKAGAAVKIAGSVALVAGATVATILTAGAGTPFLVAAGVGAAGAVTAGAAAAKTSIQTAKLEPQHEIYRTVSMAALEERRQNIQTQQVDYEALATKQLAEELEIALAERREARNLVIRYSLYGSIGILAVGGIIKVVK